MSKRNKILIVDDSEINRVILSELFSDRFETVQAADGAEALVELIAFGGEIAAILLDIAMPVMDGFTFLESFGQTAWSGKIPVILITSDSDDKTFIKGYGAGVADIINKPFNPKIVLQRVKNVVELFNYKENLEQTVGEQMEKLKKQDEKLRNFNEFMVEALSTVVEFRSHESGYHIRNIRELTKLILPELLGNYNDPNLPDEEVEMIVAASAMHDIGKIAIPDAILTKPDKLTPEEFEIMKMHTIYGCDILLQLDYVRNESYFKYCYDICRHHHERWDGKGYPDGLKGDEISLWAQAVSLADVYEALVSKRVYKQRYSHEKAVEMITNGECGAFNPLLLESFLKVAPKIKEAGLDVREQE